MNETLYMKNFILESPQETCARYPITSELSSFVLKSRGTIASILRGFDPRTLLIVGPCSIHNIDSALVYAERLKKLSVDVKDHFFIVMRTYVEKARTSLGWKGFLYDPHHDGSNDIVKGIAFTRQLLCQINALGIPCATEFLEPVATHYYSDLISWGSIGARTSSSQIHRQLASMLDLPCGFKNTCDGNITTAIQGMIVAKSPQTFFSVNRTGMLCKVESKGNMLSHLVLRGSNAKTNYDPETVNGAIQSLMREKLCPNIIIDCSHGNSSNNHRNQIAVFDELIDRIKGGESRIKGLMLESNLFEGNIHMYESASERKKLSWGISHTDPCIDWDTTAQLLFSSLERIQPVSYSSSCNL